MYVMVESKDVPANKIARLVVGSHYRFDGSRRSIIEDPLEGTKYKVKNILFSMGEKYINLQKNMKIVHIISALTRKKNK